jgi:hypothetical protein
MWPWVIGSLSLAAAVNQIAIALCRRAGRALTIAREVRIRWRVEVKIALVDERDRREWP